jgi:hypothetical protein
MTCEDGVCIAEEILGGWWDYAVRARAVWLLASGWNPEDETFVDLSRYEDAMDAETQARRTEYRTMMARAAFADAVIA